jgi:peroxiredoxin family protein
VTARTSLGGLTSCQQPLWAVHLAPEAGPDGTAAVQRLLAEGGGQHWSTVLAQAKELGEVRVHACSLSMDLFGLVQSDLDPLVDDVEGITAFMLAADGQLVVI